jgi:1-acyl-sn-glycerol-3-phosphate acyltransferase
MKVTGLEHLPETGPYIVASNHISWWDGPMIIIASGPRRYVRFLGKIELFQTPVLGWFMRQVGMIPLNRDKVDVQAIRAAIELVKDGAELALFPVGTRAKPGVVRGPKAGVGLLARETGAPVIPARVIDTDKFLRFHAFEVRFGPPLRYPEGSDGGRERYLEFAREVMNRISAL